MGVAVGLASLLLHPGSRRKACQGGIYPACCSALVCFVLIVFIASVNVNIFEYFSFELPVCLSVCRQDTLLSLSSDLPVVSVPSTQYFLLLQVLNIVHNINSSPAAQLSKEPISNQSLD